MQGYEVNTFLNVHLVNEKYQSQTLAVRTAEKNLCSAYTINIFAQVVIAEPFSLATQKSHPAISTFLKYNTLCFISEIT